MHKKFCFIFYFLIFRTDTFLCLVVKNPRKRSKSKGEKREVWRRRIEKKKGGEAVEK